MSVFGSVFGTTGGGGGTVPAASDVRFGVSVGAGSGTLVLPAIGDVRFGVDYGAGGIEFEGTYGGGAVDPSGEVPDDSRVWRVAAPGDFEAVETLFAHPLANQVYGLDVTNLLPAGVNVASAAITQSREAGRGGAVVPGPGRANAVAFTNRDGGTVEIGKGVVFTISGGSAPTDYRLAVAITGTDNRTYPASCRLQVRG